MSNLTKGFAVSYRTHGNKVVVQARHTHDSNCVLDETNVGFTLTHITNQNMPLNVLGIFEKKDQAKRRRNNAVSMFEKMGYEITTLKELA
tara:strand:- start:325 stop:594 length:270 start_codon:yes stop_codon:yes gene_type:complete